MTTVNNRYNYEQLQLVEQSLNKWRARQPLSTQDGYNLETLIKNVSTDRWNKHYGRSRRDWNDTVNIRDSVPFAFIDYLMMKRSVRTLVNGKLIACPLDNQVYRSLPYTLSEFRRQFPRVVSVLTSDHCGITLLQSWEPRNIWYKVNTPIYSELHVALCEARTLAKSHNIPLYLPHTNEFLTQVLYRVHYKMSPKRRLLSTHTLQYTRELDAANRVQQRRAIAVRAASMILMSRIHSHYDALHAGV
jgi:hypothetical protein